MRFFTAPIGCCRTRGTIGNLPNFFGLFFHILRIDICTKKRYKDNESLCASGRTEIFEK